MQIAILQCKKEYVLEGGPAAGVFANVGDTLLGAYDASKLEVFTKTTTGHVVVIELDYADHRESFELLKVIDEDAIAGMKALYETRSKYS